MPTVTSSRSRPVASATASRMEQGQITDPKALESMGHELESLERRIGTLEDEELEVMERLEEAQAHHADVQHDMEAAQDRAGSAATIRQEKTGVLDGEIAETRAQRASAAEGLPDDLLALYRSCVSPRAAPAPPCCGAASAAAAGSR